jgi:hypothetical protein
MEFWNERFKYSLSNDIIKTLFIHLYHFLFELSGVNLLLCIEFFETILILTKNLELCLTLQQK